MLIASTTDLVTTAIDTLTDGAYDLLVITIPVMVGFLLLWVGLGWVKRVFRG